MAVVYLARQTDLDRWVALKELHPEPRDGSVVRRFLRESRLAGSLSHPNIVTVLDFFERDGVGYIAMEYVPRGSLRPYVGSLTLAQTAGVLEGILAALTCAEHGGIVHRDLKPENVMITRDGRVKLTDFGIAKATGAASLLTATGTTLGTPHYMAPEQAMAQEVGPWTDLYSVGCMAYELVTGQLPVRRHRGADGDPAAPRQRRPAAGRRGRPGRGPAPVGLDRRRCWPRTPRSGRARPPKHGRRSRRSSSPLEGPRWRRRGALPAIDGGGEVPGPFTPPPSTAVPESSVFTTFDPPAARRSVTTARRRRRRTPAPERRASPTPPTPTSPPTRRGHRRLPAPPTPLAPHRADPALTLPPRTPRPAAAR